MIAEPFFKEDLDSNRTMRDDLQDSLEKSHLEPSSLSTFQRILLTTDGTVTHILEAYLYEQIQVVKISEQLITLTQDIPVMDLAAGAEVIARKIFLKGRISRRNFIYAESILVPDRLNEKFRHELLHTKTPIGKIWFENRVETFKEIVTSGKEPMNSFAQQFSDTEATTNFLFRTYCVYSNGAPTMMITEKFPENYFRQNF
jgi:chorismate-pyruvate lyase